MSQEDYTQKLVTVCEACLRACCWNGLFHCEEYQRAGTVEKTIAELEALGAEHRDYYMDEEALRDENFDLRRQLADAQKNCHEAVYLGLKHLDERDEARAEVERRTTDNAALREALEKAKRGYLNLVELNLLPSSDYEQAATEYAEEFDAILSQPNPGAGMLEELAALRKVEEAARAYQNSRKIVPAEEARVLQKEIKALDPIRNREVC